MKTIEADEAKLSEILKAIPSDRPIVMVNLLKFSRTTKYASASDVSDCSGRDAYSERYFKHAAPKIEEVGGAVIYDGDVCVGVIGENTDYWDRVLIVKYPSKRNFLLMASTPEYDALRVHRAAALDDVRLLATVENA